MYPFEGTPFIEYLVKQAADFGITDILILLGYLPEKIMDYLGDGSRFGVRIIYDVTSVEYETGARLRAAYQKINDTFLMMYCDNFCPIDFRRLVEDYRKNQSLIQVTAYRNRDGYTKNNLKIDNEGQVLVYDKKRLTEGLAGVDIGYAIVDKQALDYIGDDNVNFEAKVYPLMVEQKKMYATVTEHRYYSVGSWARIELTKEFFRPKKCVFLDRDGTLNVRPPRACYIERPEDFVWLEGAVEAVRKFKEAGWLVILISNQPGIARGNLTEEMLALVHEKMLSELRQSGGDIDAIYYCPHNWDDGCFCRKPKPGMLYQAQRDYSLNLKECVLIGDDERDIEAGEAAGCRCYLVDAENSLLQITDQLLAEMPGEE